ncbi:NAD(P)/FAD-dependent oxidoreductase [Marinoscillum sp. MHG1-6]|uniref:flavin-containing monooxygenase n=1 Tax=Marinoscillum sp. MHG1-6 TaxID=2959627 RepID=UPI0021576D70|nr:NAD(P)/FAD-dependent oxidoreductase [Marinoscillum sp. MHG1-6]
MNDLNTLIIGASAAGLSCAAQLGKIGVDYLIIEKHPHVANAWRHHYDRLHLHTNKSASNLPFLKYSSDIPKYPSRQQVVEYMEKYCLDLGINPSYETEANNIYQRDGQWITETNNGTFRSQNLIICTGNTNRPRQYTKKGLETFPGEVLHSTEYKNGKPFQGKKVLVIGFGNSACEIAICLHEHGARPALSVRSPVNVVPRDILGIPVLQIGIWQSRFRPGWVDKLNHLILRLIVGDFEKYGLKKLPYGPFEQITEHHRIPLLDVGTMDLIRKGAIRVFGDVDQIHNDLIRFKDEREEQFDAIITAVGYENGLDKLLKLDEERKEDLKNKLSDRTYFGKDNLYFCGFHVSSTGMLREVALESKIIADALKPG